RVRRRGRAARARACSPAVGWVSPALVPRLASGSNRLAGPTVTGTLSSTTPLFAALGAVAFLGEALTPAVTAGTAAIVLGVVALTWRGSGRARGWAPWGVALPLAGAALRGGGPPAAKGRV